MGRVLLDFAGQIQSNPHQTVTLSVTKGLVSQQRDPSCVRKLVPNAVGKLSSPLHGEIPETYYDKRGHLFYVLNSLSLKKYYRYLR